MIPAGKSLPFAHQYRYPTADPKPKLIYQYRQCLLGAFPNFHPSPRPVCRHSRNSDVGDQLLSELETEESQHSCCIAAEENTICVGSPCLQRERRAS